MAGYWPSYFFACLLTETKSRSINSQKKNEANIQPYYTSQAVRGPITKINQSKCSIAGPVSDRALSRMIPHLCLYFLQSCNKSLINLACSGPYWENIGPRSFLYGPRCARSVLSRPRADILPVRPSRLVNKIYILIIIKKCNAMYNTRVMCIKREKLMLTTRNRLTRLAIRPHFFTK